MSETSSSDDFSDIEYAQNKNVVVNDDISDVESFGDSFTPSPNKNLQSPQQQRNNPQKQQQLSINNKISSTQDNSDQNESFGSDEFDPDPESPPDDDQDDDDDISSKPSEMLSNSHTTRGNKFEDDINNKQEGGNNNDIPKTQSNNAQISDLYYNPRDYDGLNVNNEIRRLFEYIERFKYNEIELETQLKPFIPDYIPSIGNVDSFIKPTRTTTNYDKQENEEKLGIHYLDEPILNQSDPSTFYLKLTNESKQVSMNKHAKISAIQNAEKNTNKIRNWIDNFKKIKSKSLSNNLNIEKLNSMPKVEELMQPFINQKFNEYIKEKEENGLDIIPSYKIKLSLSEYAKIICNIIDIPVQSDNDINTSLHLLFETYAALQSTS